MLKKNQMRYFFHLFWDLIEQKVGWVKNNNKKGLDEEMQGSC